MAKTLLSNSEVLDILGLPKSILDELATAQGDEYSARANEFLSAIVNKIVYQKVYKMNFKNPFKKFEGFPVEYGDTIENIFTEMPVGYTYDKEATDPFAIKVSGVKALYATINFEMQYQVTIYRQLLKRAVLREGGLMDIINHMLANIATKRDMDEYQATVYMLNNEDLYANGFETLTIPQGATALERAKAIAKKIVNVTHDMELPCIDNNKLGVMNATRKDGVVLVIKQSVLDDIDIDFLTGVFNLEKVDMIKKENIIGVRSFQVVKPGDSTADPATEASVVGEDIDFVLLDEDGFDIHSALQESGSIYNPKGKYTNHFTDNWKIISYKYFYNARAFKVVDEE